MRRFPWRAKTTTMSVSLRVGRFDASGQAVSTSAVRVLSPELVEPGSPQPQPEYSALVAGPTHSRRAPQKAATLTVLENTPGMVVVDAMPVPLNSPVQYPHASISSFSNGGSFSSGGGSSRRPGGSPPPQLLATPQMSTAAVGRTSPLSPLVRGEARGTSAAPVKSGGGVGGGSGGGGGGGAAAAAGGSGNDDDDDQAGSSRSRRDREGEEARRLRAVPSTQRPAAIKPISDGVVRVLETAKQMAASYENAIAATAAAGGGAGSSSADAASGAQRPSPRQLLMALEQQMILDRLEQQKQYKAALQKLEDDYRGEIAALRFEMERSRKIHNLVRTRVYLRAGLVYARGRGCVLNARWTGHASRS